MPKNFSTSRTSTIPSQTDLLHAVNQGLRAHALYQRDREYIIKDGEIIIVDEFTGRLMAGRRWSDGLHQAVEAKEKVKIQSENQTLATITLQNYFRMYDKLGGMTGTAETEAEEFEKIYGLDVSVIPTNVDMVRIDTPDLVYRTEKEKFRAVIEEIVESHENGQPVLVGTVSIEKSERLSKLLQRRKVKHVVLNAKYHEREADIVAQAGRLGVVTIATNMAGRGTDIVLGGNPDGLARMEVDPAQDPEASKPRSRSSPLSAPRTRPRCSKRVGCRSSAPSGTSRAASTTSSVVVPVVRAIRVRRGSSSPSTTISCGSSPPTGSAR